MMLSSGGEPKAGSKKREHTALHVEPRAVESDAAHEEDGVRMKRGKRLVAASASRLDSEKSFCSSEACVPAGGNGHDDSHIWEDGMWRNMRRVLGHTKKGDVRKGSHVQRTGHVTFTGGLAQANHEEHGGDVAPPEETPKEEAGVRQPWALDLDQLHLEALFSAGEQKRWYMGRYLGENVAVKVSGLSDEGDQNRETTEASDKLDRMFYRELGLRLRIVHKKIVAFRGAYRSPPVWCIATEYCSSGSLHSYLKDRSPHILPLRTMVRLGSEIAGALAHLHSHGVVHGLLSTHNVMVVGEGMCDRSIRIVDYGLAQLESASTDTLSPEARQWNAPEMIRNKPYDHKVDVYSFGLIFWALFSGECLFTLFPPEVAIYEVAHNNLRPEISGNCPAEVRQLMTLCWRDDPNERPEFEQVLEMLRSFGTNVENSVGRARVRRAVGMTPAPSSS